MSKRFFFSIATLGSVAALMFFVGAYVDADSTEVSVSVFLPACSDGIDNDGDTLIDFPADTDCVDGNDDDEAEASSLGGSGDDDDTTGAGDTVSSGGGGGSSPAGVSTVPRVSDIHLEGIAYPDASVVLLRGGLLVASENAAENGGFSFVLNDIAQGEQIFSLYAVDMEGRRSGILAFSVRVPAHSLVTVNDVIIPPTIAFSQTPTAFKIFGSGVPAGVVEVSIGEQHFLVRSEEDGNYTFVAGEGEFVESDYLIKARNVLGDRKSSYSTTISARLGQEAEAESVSDTPSRSDLNDDGRINLVDFSIMGFWYQRSNPPEHLDLNDDNRVDLIDFSILAHHWTG